MKFAIYITALLPIVGAFQSSPSKSRSTALRMAFLPDPANTPFNQLGSYRYGHLPGSDKAPDGTKYGVSVNKGTYERLNDYQAPVHVSPTNPFATGQSDGGDKIW